MTRNIVRSRDRVENFGEVFTPEWLVEDMLDLVADEAARPESRFLEPACGTGNFLVAVLRRKLATVSERSGGPLDGLAALSTLYGVELLADNVATCRKRLLEEFALWLDTLLPDKDKGEYLDQAREIIKTNIVHGDFLTAICLETHAPIEFYEWEKDGTSLKRGHKTMLNPYTRGTVRVSSAQPCLTLS